MNITLRHRHGWVFGLAAGLVVLAVIVTIVMAGRGTVVARTKEPGLSSTAIATTVSRTDQATNAPTPPRTATHPKTTTRGRTLRARAGRIAGCWTGYVTLSFDDGPDPASTPRLLAALRRTGLHATFFDVGQRIAEYPQLARQTVQYGNAVEDHTWDHCSLTGASTRTRALTTTQVTAELDRAKRAIILATGERPHFLRPPYGDTNAAVQRLAGQLGLIEVGWTVDSNDYTEIGTRQLVANVLQVRAGGVVIMHDSGHLPTTIAAIPAIAAGLHARGLCAGRLIPSPSGTSGWEHGTFHVRPAAW
jgi:peptidoglycan/xylan/chitin deacetylase (PgdA/CDA1 family)